MKRATVVPSPCNPGTWITDGCAAFPKRSISSIAYDKVTPCGLHIGPATVTPEPWRTITRGGSWGDTARLSRLPPTLLSLPLKSLAPSRVCLSCSHWVGWEVPFSLGTCNPSCAWRRRTPNPFPCEGPVATRSSGASLCNAEVYLRACRSLHQDCFVFSFTAWTTSTAS